MPGPRSVLGRALWERRRATLAWGVGALALGSVAVVAYPTVRDSPAIATLLDEFHPAFLALFGVDKDSFSTGLGFVTAQLYTLIAPLLVLVFAIGAGASVTAAEEEAGTADLLLAHPVRRWRVVAEGLLAVALSTALLPAALAAAMLVGNAVVDLGLPLGAIAGLSLGLWLLGLFFAALAAVVGAWAGRRAAATAVASAVAVAAFFVNGLGPFVPALRAVGRWTPFHAYLAGPASVEPNARHLALAAATLGLVALAVLAFGRRDLGCAPRWPRGLRRRAPRRTAGGRLDGLLRGVYGKTLWERRITVFFWAAGLWGLAAATAGIWPVLQESSESLARTLELVPPELFTAFGMRDPEVLLTPAGFISSRVYASVGPVILIVLAVGVTTSAVATECRRGTMDLVLSTPVARRRVALESTAAMATLVVALAAGLVPVLWLVDALLELGLGFVPILAASTALGATALTFGALGLAVGGATGRPGIARGVVVAAVLGGLALNLAGATVPALAPVRALSPMYWLLAEGPPLAHGFSSWTLASIAAAVLLTAAGTVAFERRDV